MREYTEHYLGGAWVPSSGSGHFDVVDASTEAVLGRVPAGTTADAERAVTHARAAFDGWMAESVATRADALDALADALAARQTELGELIASEVGMPIKLASGIQAGLPIQQVRAFASMVRELRLEENVGSSLVVREPVGVVAAITPWNYPLNQVIGKVAPALAVGCTVVLKPSEVAPLSAYVLAECVHALGLPAGVFNLVSGEGPVVGEALATHPEVDMVSFTGSTRAGRRVAELAAGTIKRVALELGGKSASVVLDDADLERAIKGSMSQCFLNSGQTCSALSRVLVPRARLPEAEALARACAERFTLGPALEGKGRLGPLVSGAQRERVRRYIEQGVAEGATLVTGGADAPAELPRGFFVKPTVLSDVTPTMTVAREEIFGPVICLMGYDDEDDAVRIANDSPYGLSGAVWSADGARAQRVARRLRTGQVDINGAPFNPFAPFGGYKQSGIGREFGRHGLEEFLEIKSLQL